MSKFNFIRRFSILIALLAILVVAMPASAALVYTFTGTIADDGETDSYNVTLNAGDFVLVRATCDEVAPGDRPLDPVVTVFDPTNSDVAYNDDGNQPACNNFDTACTTFTAAVSGTFRFDVYDAAGGPFPAPYTLVIVVGDPTAVCGGSYEPPVGTNVEVPMIKDGRANGNDLGASFAVYCKFDGIEVYGIDFTTSLGQLAFFTTPAEIATVPEFPEVNTIIESGLGVDLYRLTSGEFQIVGPIEANGKTYNVIFRECPRQSILRGFMFPE